MLETIFSGLCIAFLTGLGVISQRYPKTFNRIIFPLFFLHVVIWLILFAYDFGVMTASNTIPFDSIEVRKAVRAKEINMTYLMLYGFGFMIFLFVLSILSKMFNEEKNDNPKKPMPKKNKKAKP